MDGVDGFDPADFPLHKVAVAQWEGFLFISLDPEPEPFEDAFAALMGRFARFNISRLQTKKRIDYDVRCNWKLLFQNYSECYHCPAIHPGLVKLSPADSGENDLVEGPFLGGDFRCWGPEIITSAAQQWLATTLRRDCPA